MVPPVQRKRMLSSISYTERNFELNGAPSWETTLLGISCFFFLSFFFFWGGGVKACPELKRLFKWAHLGDSCQDGKPPSSIHDICKFWDTTALSKYTKKKGKFATKYIQWPKQAQILRSLCKQGHWPEKKYRRRWQISARSSSDGNLLLTGNKKCRAWTNATERLFERGWREEGGQKLFGQCSDGRVSLRQKGASLNCTHTEKHFSERYSSNNTQEIHF